MSVVVAVGNQPTVTRHLSDKANRWMSLVVCDIIFPRTSFLAPSLPLFTICSLHSLTRYHKRPCLCPLLSVIMVSYTHHSAPNTNTTRTRTHDTRHIGDVVYIKRNGNNNQQQPTATTTMVQGRARPASNCIHHTQGPTQGQLCF